MTQDLVKAIVEVLFMVAIIGGLLWLGYLIIISIVREEIKKQAGEQHE